MAERDTTGAAKRRRERRLRMHWRHEQLTLRTVLATRTALHGDRRQPPGPGAEKRETYLAPRRQEASSAHWYRCAVLLDVRRRERGR